MFLISQKRNSDVTNAVCRRIPLGSPEGFAAFKLMAIANRGDQAKDFIDVYYLLKEMELVDMFEYYKRKFNQSDINPIKRSLVYFDDVTESNWLSVKLLKDDFSIDNVKQTLIDKVNEYNKKVIEEI